MIWQVCQHRRLYHGHDLAGLGANHREAKNLVVTPTNKNLHEPLGFVRGTHCPIGARGRAPGGNTPAIIPRLRILLMRAGGTSEKASVRCISWPGRRSVPVVFGGLTQTRRAACWPSHFCWRAGSIVPIHASANGCSGRQRGVGHYLSDYLLPDTRGKAEPPRTGREAPLSSPACVTMKVVLSRKTASMFGWFRETTT